MPHAECVEQLVDDGAVSLMLFASVVQNNGRAAQSTRRSPLGYGHTVGAVTLLGLSEYRRPLGPGCSVHGDLCLSFDDGEVGHPVHCAQPRDGVLECSPINGALRSNPRDAHILGLPTTHTVL